MPSESPPSRPGGLSLRRIASGDLRANFGGFCYERRTWLRAPAPKRRPRTLCKSAQQFLRNVPTIVCELLQHGLVQPHVHVCRVAHLVSRAAELGRKRLARRKAAVETQKLQQIHDRDLPIELLGIGGGEFFELTHDIDH